VTHVGTTALTGSMFQCVLITCAIIPEVPGLDLGRVTVCRRHSVAFVMLQ
jgi:hypothetical protein